ncbi:MAG: hypothetical protein RIC55_14350 [Pirellulaceae bacterium]
MSVRCTIRIPAAVVLAVTTLLSTPWGSTSDACPICPAAGKTFSEEIASVDVAVIARPRPGMQDDTDEFGLTRTTFEIVEIIKGAKHLAGRRTVESAAPADAKDGAEQFLLTAVGPEELLWSSPLPMSPRAIAYLKAALQLPETGAKRLDFFQQYFEDEDPRLAADACDEFSRLPYAEIRGHGPNMNHDRLIELIQSEGVSDGHRRLYFTMLSACGRPADVPLLEGFLRGDDEKRRRGLDALIVCYLMLRGDEGMPLVEKRFLENEQVDYAETYAAIMAYRFLGGDPAAREQTQISRSRLLEGLRPILARPDLADLVIPDFASWEDWSVMEQLVELFKTADPKTTWVRVPVVNYLRQCPLPKADRLLAELEKLDPDSIRRAKTYFPEVKQAG